MENEKINAIGKIWEKAGYRRLYVRLDVAMRLIGLDVSYYRTGNISGATLKGELISNRYAGRIIASLKNCYYDLNAKKLVNDDFDWDDQILAAVEEALA